jgi:hypothetical protein
LLFQYQLSSIAAAHVWRPEAKIDSMTTEMAPPPVRFRTRTFQPSRSDETGKKMPLIPSRLDEFYCVVVRTDVPKQQGGSSVSMGCAKQFIAELTSFRAPRNPRQFTPQS